MFGRSRDPEVYDLVAQRRLWQEYGWDDETFQSKSEDEVSRALLVLEGIRVGRVRARQRKNQLEELRRVGGKNRR